MKAVFSKNKPEKSLITILKKHSGRDSAGHVSVRHQGGRRKRYYRLIDFKRTKRGIEGKVVDIQYDPNRNAHIALVQYSDGEKRYILHPKDLLVGASIIASDDADVKPGNALPLKKIPIGFLVHNVELLPGQGGQAFLPAPEHAGDVRADLEVIRPDGGAVIEGIERHDLMDMGGRHVQERGDPFLGLQRHGPEMLLDRMEHRQHRRLLARILRKNLFGLASEVF